MSRAASPFLVRLARKALSATAPKLYREISYYRNEGRLLRITRKLVARYGCRVMGGPFQGMHYLEQSVCSVLNPKLVGSYEQELHNLLEQAIARDYETVVDIGCAEGYYAVGMLFRMKHTRCVAFDLDARARELCMRLAQLNDVDGWLTLLEQCDPDSLKRHLPPRSFVLSDCEGAELDILYPSLVPNLRTCDILVELHDFLRPGLRSVILQRFAATHHAQIIEQQERNGANYSQLGFLSAKNRHMAVQECRPARMQWAMFTSKVEE